MKSILEKSKEFEYLVTTFDPLYDDIVIVIEIVKQFIIDNKLIIYGGSAIDYALRLKGDKIYPDDLLKVPDLDFYSPMNVEHSYQLADILFMRGYREVRAVNAQHTETMRVDLADNHWIADISYRPQEIFDKLPYLEYNGIRVIHPDFQRVDVHSSLSFPYDNAPREVIFERWSKDIKRFNKLAAHYPITLPTTFLQARPTTTSLQGHVFTGFAAYALIYNEFSKLMGSQEYPLVVPAKLELQEHRLSFDTIEQACEIVHFDIKRAAADLEMAANYEHYEPYINLRPERIECEVDGTNIIIYSTKNRLLASNTIKLSVGGTMTCRITNIQYLLKYFLSMYFVTISSPKLANTYLARYVSLLHMINAVEDKYAIQNADGIWTVDLNNNSVNIFFPTVRTYGNDNINLAREIALNRLYNDLNDVPLYRIPFNYYPSRSKLRNVGHPQFTPRDLEFFRVEGLKITD